MFILKVPKWQGEIIFNQETVSFLMVIALMLAGLILCFMGYKYLQVLCILVLGCITGMTGIWIGDRIISNPVVKMSFFVMFTFLGVCMFYFISILFVWITKKLHIRHWILKWQYFIAAILGAGTVSAAAYLYVYRSILTDVVLFVGLTAAGTLWGKKHAAKRKNFYTYDDLYERSPLQKKGEEAC